MSSQNVSKAALWTGWVITVLPAGLMIFSAVVKLLKVPDVVKGMTDFGYPQHLIVPIGIVELTCAVIFLIPRSAVLGAILITGYLGGATATNVRVQNPGFFMPALLGMFAWFGLFLRDRRIRSLIPFWK